MSYADELPRMWGVGAAGRRRLDLYRACQAVHFLEFADGDVNRRDRLMSQANTWLTAAGER